MWETLPWLFAMALLICCSGFFSASEAALFCLRWPDRRVMAQGTHSQRAAERLLADPDRLLSAVLFWNLLVNLIYFAISAIVALRLERSQNSQTAMAFSTVALLILIFFSEMLPKSLAVIRPRLISSVAGLPMSVMVRVVDPVMPILRTIMLYSRRLIWPSLQAEEPLQIDDIDRAIELSREDEHIVATERLVLGNIVKLSSITALEWMTPRSKLRSLPAPVSLEMLSDENTTGGYAFVAAADGDDVVAAIPTRTIQAFPPHHLERHAQEVAIVPWCSTLAAVWEALQEGNQEVAAVVNEFGETIGVVTLEDVWDALFSASGGRGERVLDRDPITRVAHDLWHVDGMTNLRRLEEHFTISLPDTNLATIGGVIQETLERLPQVSDRGQWGPLHFEVVQADESTLLLAIRISEESQPL